MGPFQVLMKGIHAERTGITRRVTGVALRTAYSVQPPTEVI